MKILGRAILAASVAVMIAGTVAYASGGDTVSLLPGTATKRISASGARTIADVKGSCDEADHANDARCNGGQASDDQRRAEDRNDDREGTLEQEGPDDSGHHFPSTVSSQQTIEMETGVNSERSREMDAEDDSGHHSGNSGVGIHGSSGRDHPEDD